MDVSNKVALVTGGARGLGKGYAEALLKRGAKVVLTDVLEDVGLATEKEFKLNYGEENVLYVGGDVTIQEDMEALFNVTIREFGRLDIMINNAGVGMGQPVEFAFDINVFAVIRCTELAMAQMDKEKGGQGGVIINISSQSGLFTYPYCCEVYQASKFAVVGYSGSLGKKLATSKSGIRVCCVCPGLVKTALTHGFEQEDEPPNRWTKISQVVDAVMACIETDVPSGSTILSTAPENMIAELGTMTFTNLL